MADLTYLHNNTNNNNNNNNTNDNTTTACWYVCACMLYKQNIQGLELIFLFLKR